MIRWTMVAAAVSITLSPTIGIAQTVPQAAEDAVKRIPDARLIRLNDLGHSPQVESPPQFMEALRTAIGASDDANLPESVR